MAPTARGLPQGTRAGACRVGTVVVASTFAYALFAAALRMDSHSEPAGAFVSLSSAEAGHGRLRHRSRTSLRVAPVDLSHPSVQKFIKQHVVDEEATQAAAEPFPIPPEELVELAKLFLATEAPEALSDVRGYGKMLADDFLFIGPVIGPLNKEEFLDTVEQVDFFAIFPDATAQMHHFRVDPFEPQRVWYTVRGTGTHTGAAEPGSATEMMFGDPTQIRFVNPPQACSIRFTEDGKVDQFTIGYVMDRYIGNTGGLGGFFGPLNAIGKHFPFEEGQPWRPSLGYQIYVRIGAFFNELRDMLEGKEPKALIYMPKGSDEPVRNA